MSCGYSTCLTDSTATAVCLLLCYVLAISRVISAWALTYDNAHSWWLYSAAPLVAQATCTVPWYPTQSHYPDTESISPCPILIMLNTRLGIDKYQFWSHWLDSTRVWWTHECRIIQSPKTGDGRSTHSVIPSSPVIADSVKGVGTVQHPSHWAGNTPTGRQRPLHGNPMTMTHSAPYLIHYWKLVTTRKHLVL